MYQHHHSQPAPVSPKGIGMMTAPSVHSVSPSLSSVNANNIHPAVQKLYEQQQTLLNKLQMLEKDDPNPQSSRLWNIMHRIFTEESAQQRQQNIEDLTLTLDEKHKQVRKNHNEHKDDENDESLLKSIHEISKETVNE